MKHLLSVLLLFVVVTASAQKAERDLFPPSDSVRVTGKITSSVTYSLKDLSGMADTGFAALKIVNHHGEFKANFTNVKAISLSKLIDKKLMSVAKPKELSSIYFVFKAVDGYTVVYSYNELFGDKKTAFILTAYNDLTLTTMPEKPSILTLSAPGTANVGLKGLASIDVRKAE